MPCLSRLSPVAVSMDRCALLPLCVAASLASSGCGGEDVGGTATTTGALKSWAIGNMSQVLRVDPGSNAAVRNICELEIRLDAYAPLSVTGSGDTTSGVSSSTLGWKGAAIAMPGLRVSGCSSYPCNVTARWEGTYVDGAAAGPTLGCQVVADDGVARWIGDSTGSKLVVPDAQTAPVIFHQSVRLGPPSGAGAAMCVLRQNGALPTAEVQDFEVFLDGATKVSVPGPIAIGSVPWSTKRPDPVWGSIYVGAETGATRIKHVAPRALLLAEGNAYRCAGSYYGASATHVFDANVGGGLPGDGVTMTTGTTGWTCSAAQFGTANGCNTGCGIPDPDCPVCGNGVLEAAEQCDDGNWDTQDGCDATCMAEAPFEIEPNGSLATATPLWPATTTWKGAITPVGDQDYFTFSLASTGSVTLVTHAPDSPGTCGFDTVIYLLNSVGTYLAMDDEGGPGSCSKIDPISYPAASSLSPGTYFVRVQRYADAQTIAGYQLDLTIQ